MRMPEMVERGDGSDPARPGAEIALRLEPRSSLVDAPESFHCEILGDTGVANDADNPGVNFLLVLPKQRLEGFQVARRETLQQLHLPLSITTYSVGAPIVTAFSRVWRFPILGAADSSQ